MFPYRFMQPSTFLYRGPVPALEYFLDRDMNADKAETVKAFHAELVAEGGEWDAGEEVLKYLRSDVHLLRGGVVGILKEVFDFQEGLDNTTSLPFHAFSDAVTGPALAHKLFRFYGLRSDRQVYLTENSNNHRKTSTSEMQFCSYLEWKLNVPLRTAYNHPKGQLRVGGRFYADAVLESARLIFDFNGCLYHGHVALNPDCPLSSNLTEYNTTPYGQPLRDAYHRWRLRKQRLEEAGWRVLVMWECEWLAMKEAAHQHRDLHTFLNVFYRSRPLERLSPRRAMRGGRCESFRLCFDADVSQGYSMRYIDVNSLYPHIATRGTLLPVGKPTVLIGAGLRDVTFDADSGSFLLGDAETPLFGLIQCKILPPESLFLPVLPVLADDKLFYPLCNACLKHRLPRFCRHRPEQRALTDVWTLVEVAEALKMGYTLLDTYEMLVYCQGEPIFQKYYTHLAAIKLSNEGFPSWVSTAEDKAAYVAILNARMPGLGLSVADIVHNKAKRAFGKNLSNTGLGKFSQNPDKLQTSLVSHWNQISALRYSPSQEITAIVPLTPHVAQVSHRQRQERAGVDRHTQVVIYSYITSHARLKMIQDMRRLQMEFHCLPAYVDTDGVLFIMPASTQFDSIRQAFEVGQVYYGAYKEETATPIVQYASISPKNYSYVTEDGEQSVKIRGFRLGQERTKRILNSANMRSLLLDALDGKQRSLVTETNQFRLNLKKQTVTTTTLRKEYRNYGIVPKRWLPPDRNDVDQFVTTIPFGAVHANYSDMPPLPPER